MAIKSPFQNEQRRYEKSIHDAICSELPIAYSDAHDIDTKLFEDERCKRVVTVFQKLYESPKKQPSAQDIAVEIELSLKNHGYSGEDAASEADAVEDFRGIQPNTLLVRQALNALKTDTVTSTQQINDSKDLNVYESIREICMDSHNMTFEEKKESCIALFNATHSVVKHGQKIFVCEKSHDHKGNLVYYFYSVTSMKNFYANLNISFNEGDKVKTVNCFELWLKSPFRKVYQGVIFDPSNTLDSNFLNLWNGLPVEPIEGDDRLDRIMWHLRNIICDGNEQHFRYLLAWLAHLIQKPEEKSGVCVVLQSEAKGTGKSTVARLVEAIWGEHSITVQDAAHLFGNFNAHLANKIFVTIEEAFWSGSKKDAGKFRTLITENTLVIEGKGKDAVKLDSYHRYLLITNNDWAVPQTANERRFFVLSVSETKAKNRQYFDDLYSYINDRKTIGQLVNFLQHYDISEFDLRNAPYTDARQEQVWSSLESHEQWFREILEYGEIIDGNMVYDLDQEQYIPKSSFFRSYKDYCIKCGLKAHQIVSIPVVAKYLLNKVCVVKDGGKIQVKYLGRCTCYTTDSLDVMKEKFQNYYAYK